MLLIVEQLIVLHQLDNFLASCYEELVILVETFFEHDHLLAKGCKFGLSSFYITHQILNSIPRINEIILKVLDFHLTFSFLLCDSIHELVINEVLAFTCVEDDLELLNAI